MKAAYDYYANVRGNLICPYCDTALVLFKGEPDPTECPICNRLIPDNAKRMDYE